MPSPLPQIEALIEEHRLLKRISAIAAATMKRR
jgi:hypothetical protein